RARGRTAPSSPRRRRAPAPRARRPGPEGGASRRTTPRTPRALRRSRDPPASRAATRDQQSAEREGSDRAEQAGAIVTEIAAAAALAAGRGVEVRDEGVTRIHRDGQRIGRARVHVV